MTTARDTANFWRKTFRVDVRYALRDMQRAHDLARRAARENRLGGRAEFCGAAIGREMKQAMACYDAAQRALTRPI